MQNKGAITFLAIVLAVACLYQLSFTFVTRSVEKEARLRAGGNSAVEAAYLDSMKTEPVYNLGFIKYTYAEAKEKELNLGLDLRGGMNVMLQVSVRDVLEALSENSRDEAFNQALDMATEKEKHSNSDYITLFAESYKSVAPTGRLSAIFSSNDLKESIARDASNEQVIEALRGLVESAISNSFNVLTNRIDRFGVTQPNIQKIGNTGRILVELPGVKEPERVRKLLQGTASLEFWETYDNKDLFPALQQINRRLADMAKVNAATDSAAVKEDSTLFAGIDNVVDSTALMGAEFAKNNPLFALLQPSVDPQSGQPYSSPVVGMAKLSDMKTIDSLLSSPQIKTMLPRGLKLMWGVKPVDKAGTAYELYAINANTKDGKPKLDGSVVTEARPEYSQYGSTAEVSMTMNQTGARVWARMTADNVNKFIAIVLDGSVYSAPRVNGEISGGRSSITGDFTINDATDLANVLKSGKLPAPAKIVQEAVVGPSLGQESINAGMMSFVLAFVLVLLYMICYYSTAGLVASIALICNLFFLFGVLSSFGAVLTLPGIAGIVLTMGMAVDANVIIYERIKEEVKAGKAVSLAITDGFKNAYSAIIDGNVTTLITGVILFMFGSGPVQGFATTLIIGILTSLFCAIFITRIIFVSMLQSNKRISFSNRFTRNFLENTKINFLRARKATYIVSGALMLLTVVSFFVNGFSQGVDFTGGRAYVIRFDRDVTANEVREALGQNEIFQTGLEVKQYGDANQMRIITQYKGQGEGAQAMDEMNSLLYRSLKPLYADQSLTEIGFTTNLNPVGIISSDEVGPSVAGSMKRDAFWAVFFSLVAIGLYIAARFKKWQWSMGSVVSLFHDAFLTIGAFSLLWKVMPFELEVNQAFIAAILTIIGYSINDKVVIFDRIREYERLYPKRNMGLNINEAINSTLVRTLNTSGTTFVVLLAIFIFGGEVIRGFIFALGLGVLISTYSTVFIATPIAFDMMPKSIRERYEGAKARK